MNKQFDFVHVDRYLYIIKYKNKYRYNVSSSRIRRQRAIPEVTRTRQIRPLDHERRNWKEHSF